MHGRRMPWPLLAGAGVLVAGIGFALGDRLRDEQAPPSGSSAAQDLGGDFTLIGAGGAPASLADFRGEVVMLFFGYTYCPDICPQFLQNMKVLHRELGQDAARFRGLLISVDPARDTPERLHEYVTYFHESFRGLTGSKQAIDRVVRAYGAGYTLQPADGSGNYVVDHTSLGYLIDGEGRVRHLLPGASPLAEQIELTRTLIQELAD